MLPSMSNMIQIAWLMLSLTNMVETAEPAPGNTAWYTNNNGTNLVISGIATLTAHLGPTIQLSWTNDNVVLQASPDLITWTDLQVKFIGVYVYITDPFNTRFYRLRHDA